MFVTVEGVEGGGKSTNMAFIESYLSSMGKTVVVTREPGGTHLGEQLRAILLDPENKTISDSTELLLMFAARSQHISEVIQPALNEGKVVLCDRFTDATYAYQGGGRNMAHNRIAILEDWVQGQLKPDLTFLLDIDVSIGLERASKRGSMDRFEQEKQQFFERVRNSYLSMAQAQPERYRVIQAGNPLDQVQANIKAELDKVFS